MCVELYRKNNEETSSIDTASASGTAVDALDLHESLTDDFAAVADGDLDLDRVDDAIYDDDDDAAASSPNTSLLGAQWQQQKQQRRRSTARPVRRMTQLGSVPVPQRLDGLGEKARHFVAEAGTRSRDAL